MLEEYPEVLSVNEVCEILTIGRNNLYVLLNQHKLKAFRNGRVWKIPKQAVIDYICHTSFLKITQTQVEERTST